MFQTFRGSPALSEFRIQGLMQKFQQNQLPVKSVYAEYLHFVELNRPLVSEQEAKLKALLHYGPTLAEHDAKGETFIVIPRVGTISSWSSKATDIAHNCGLNEVERIERGLAYYFELSQPHTRLGIVGLKESQTCRGHSQYLTPFHWVAHSWL